MRTSIYDTFKNRSQLRTDHDKTCGIEGCDNSITMFKGPGSDKLCREQQLQQREYGGAGRLDRPHTFHRNCVCDNCGKNVKEEVTNKFPDLEEADPDLFNRLWRNRIIGDHIIRQADGGNDSAENIQSLCLDCNSDKTIVNQDYRKSTLTEKQKSNH